MKRTLIALATFLICTTCYISPAYSAESLSVNIDIDPKPQYGQLNAEKTYLFNITVANHGLSIFPGQLIEEDPLIRYTGFLNSVVDISWRASGSYDFGVSTSGYSVQLDNINFTTVLDTPINGSSLWYSFSHTFERDAFDFGVKPYETLEVKVKARVYLEIYNVSDGMNTPYRGPMIAENLITMKLLDDTKIRYVEGKYLDLVSEVEPLKSVSEAEYINASLFLSYLSEMNQSIEDRDYFSALKIFSKYDTKYRTQLISSLTEEASASIEKTFLISQLEQDLDYLNVTYQTLEDKYVSLFRTYQGKQTELEAVKQNLSTAITGVFLASIAFFFVGRKSMSRDIYLGNQTLSEEGEPYDPEPSIR